MKFTTNTARILEVSHGKEKLSVNLSRLAASNVVLNNVYVEVNKFFESLPKVVQSKIFSIYKEVIEMEMDSYFQIRSKVIELYECIHLEDIKSLIKELDIPIPTLKKEYNYTDTIDNGISYIETDYLDLVEYVVYLRPLIPIFGHVAVISPKTEKKLREEIVFDLTKDSIVRDHDAYRRLERYMASFCIDLDKKISFAQIKSGKSSEDKLEEFIALNVTRRLCFFAFGKDAAGEASNIISNIYNYTTNKVNGSCSPISNGETYRNKDMKLTNEDGRVRSFVDNYATAQKTADGDRMLAAMDITLDRLDILHRIEPELDLDVVRDLFKHNVENSAYIKELIYPQYVLNDLISARMLAEVSNVNNERLLAFTATQAILCHWGFYNLALMTTGKRRELPYSVVYQNSKKLLSDENLEMLDKVYPEKISPKGEPVNVAVHSIATLVSKYTGHTWSLTAPAWMIEKGNMKKDMYGYLTTRNIRNELASLYIKLSQLEVKGYV